jgi:hypothetical protein
MVLGAVSGLFRELFLVVSSAVASEMEVVADE